MEISPRELRDAEIPDSFRGYNRDVVDEFLERAAATIEALQERNRQLTERLQSALAAAEAAASAPPVAAEVAPPPPPPPAPVAVEPEPEPEPAPVASPVWTQAPEPMPEPMPEPALPAVAAGTALATTGAGFSDDLIQRTLLMAQKAADETVSEADQYAMRTREAANTDAAKAIADAQAEAERLSAERRAVTDRALVELEARRVELETGLDVLERFDADYRARLRSAIEADLASIERRPVLSPGTRPAIAAVMVDAIEAGDQAAALESGPEATDDDADDGATAAGNLGDTAADGVLLAEMLALDEAEGSDAEAEPALTAAQDDALDDDEFFASLREAVHDDAPLGPLDRDGGLFPKE